MKFLSYLSLSFCDTKTALKIQINDYKTNSFMNFKADFMNLDWLFGFANFSIQIVLVKKALGHNA